MELLGVIKNYEWGKKGASSLVAQLYALNSSGFKVDPLTPYAEMWMGSHPSGKAKLKATGKDLPQNLPYLLKVLSVNKALSIQVHPSKEEAACLHAQRPCIYPDPNHKPEMAIALTPFVAMCGVRPYSEIHRFLMDLKPLRQLLAQSEVTIDLIKNNDPAGLKRCYERMFTVDPYYIRVCIDSLLESYRQALCCFELLDLLTHLHLQYPYDVGLLSLFFLNIVKLKPGEAIFLKPKELHAYISGDCVECMANSDNVIRAGLTPKFKDHVTLLECANFTGQSKESQIYQPDSADEFTKFYAPVKDFALIQLKVPPSNGIYKLRIRPVGCIMLVLSGERKLVARGFDPLTVKRGSIIYIPPEAGREVDLDDGSTENSEFTAYIAMENVGKPED